MRCGGAPLGVVDDPELSSFERTLDRGSLVVLYSDGAIEDQLDAMRGEYMLIAAAKQHRDATDPAAAIFNRSSVKAGRAFAGVDDGNS